MSTSTVRSWSLRPAAFDGLYARHGFTVEGEDPVDIYMVRLHRA